MTDLLRKGGEFRQSNFPKDSLKVSLIYCFSTVFSERFICISSFPSRKENTICILHMFAELTH